MVFFFKLFNKISIFFNIEKKFHSTVFLVCFLLVFDVAQFYSVHLDRTSFYESTIKMVGSHSSVNFELYFLTLKCSCIDFFLTWQIIRVNEKDFLQFLLVDF